MYAVSCRTDGASEYVSVERDTAADGSTSDLSVLAIRHVCSFHITADLLTEADVFHDRQNQRLSMIHGEKAPELDTCCNYTVFQKMAPFSFKQ